MADVIGPTPTMPGAIHKLPENTMCDQHPDRPAVQRIQGETDSFGAELNDLCAECVNELRMSFKREREGRCDWCKEQSNSLKSMRDFEEGSCGPLYDVCGHCRAQYHEAVKAAWCDDED